MQEMESGEPILQRYNATHEMWVQLQFGSMDSTQGGESLDGIIIETLKGEFIKNTLTGEIFDLSKQTLTKVDPGVTIPSTKKRRGKT